MATVYKRKDSPYYWTSGRDGTGERWYESTRAKDKATAVKLARKIHRRRLLQTAEGPNLPLIDALELLRKHKVRRELSAATMKIHEEKGGRLLVVLGRDRNVCALTLMEADAYVDLRLRQGAGLSTIEKEWGILRASLRLAARHNLYPFDPSRIWPDALRNVDKPRTRWLTVEEAQKLLPALPPARADHFLAYVHTGVRHSELYKMTAADVDAKERSVFVAGTKGNLEKARRRIPLSQDVWPVFQRRMLRHPKGPLFPDVWSSSAMARALKKASAMVKIPQVDSANDLRRTFATWLLHADVPEATTVRLMGHTNSKMVRRVYAQHSAGLLRGAIDRLPSLRNGYVTTPPAKHALRSLDARRNPHK